jgi:hypothetical protein
MRLLTLPITVVRVPFELGFGAAKGVVKFAHGLVAGGEEVEEKPRPAPPPRRRRTSTRASSKSGGNGRGRSGAATRRSSRRPAAPSRHPAEEAMEAAPPIDEPPSAAPAAPSTAAPAAGEPAGPPAEATPPEPRATEVPTHVDEEAELVSETAEAGAEDGAGAEVEIDEPWPGYDQMTAPDIEERLLAEGPEAAATVRLYEASGKGRASILEAASRTMAT